MVSGPKPPDAASTSREQALSGLFRAHCVELVRLAYCLLGDRQRAEEAVQDAFLTLFRQWPLREESSALAYLRAGVVNRCRSDQRRMVRARAKEPLVLAGVRWAQVAPDAGSDVISRDVARGLAEAVRGLPQRQREVIICRYYLHLSERETADLLEMSLGTVKSHTHRGLTALQVRLEGSP